MNYKQSNPTRLYFGYDSITNLENEIKDVKNILVTYGKESIKKVGLYDEVMSILKNNDKNVFELSGIKPNPDIKNVYDGIKICKDNDVDLILAIGGGSVIDCSKIISIGAQYDGDIWLKIKNKAYDLKAHTRLGVILTNAATSSENNYFAVISNEKEALKLGTAFWPAAYPDFSILDPKNTVSLPLSTTVDSIVDICSHLFETYFHNMDLNNPIIRIVNAELEALLKETINVGKALVKDLTNIGYRETIMFIASQALSTRLRHIVNGDWSCHAIEHALSAVYDIPHGGGLAILTPFWMDHCVEAHVERFKNMAVNVFGVKTDGKTDLEIAKEGIQSLRIFFNEIGAPTRLSDYNINDSALDELVKKSMNGAERIGGMSGLTETDVRDILVASM